MSDDLDLLVGLLEEEEATTSEPKKKEMNQVDPLEVELRQMEEKMNLLKQQLAKKKNIPETEQSNFTKYVPVVKQPTETTRILSSSEGNSFLKKLEDKKSAIHSGDTDSEDEEDNRNPMETTYCSGGRDIRKRLAHASDEKILSQRKDVTPFVPKSGWNEAKGGSLLAMGHKPNLEKDNNPGIADPFSGIKMM